MMTADPTSGFQPGEEPSGFAMHDDAFVRWIPIVVPLLALFLAVAVAFIGAEIL